MKTIRQAFVVITLVFVVAVIVAAEPQVTDPEVLVSAEEIALDQQTLDQLAKAGSNLSLPHNIEYFLYLISRVDADAAATVLRAKGYSVKVQLAADGNSWLCLATQRTVPTIQNLTEARKHFKSLAGHYKGEYDGWGTAIVE